jgi:hypothetical protein
MKHAGNTEEVFEIGIVATITLKWEYTKIHVLKSRLPRLFYASSLAFWGGFPLLLYPNIELALLLLLFTPFLFLAAIALSVFNCKTLPDSLEAR